MRLYNYYVAILFFFTFNVTTLYAQMDVITSGGEASGTGGSASYSVGQSNYSYIKSNDGSASQGVQQTWEISVVKEETGTGFQISATAYPNPTSSFLNIRIDEGKIEDLSYRIYDMDGRLIAQQKIVSKETTISIKDLSNTLYFVKVYKSIFVMKTFKIVKTK